MKQNNDYHKVMLLVVSTYLIQVMCDISHVTDKL